MKPFALPKEFGERTVNPAGLNAVSMRDKSVYLRLNDQFESWHFNYKTPEDAKTAYDKIVADWTAAFAAT